MIDGSTRVFHEKKIGFDAEIVDGISLLPGNDPVQPRAVAEFLESNYRLSQLRRDNPLAVFNPSWDSRRLWLVKFVEQSRKLRIEGFAQDGEDVSELARRMNLSSYFADVRLLPAVRQIDNTTHMEVVSFALEGTAVGNLACQLIALKAVKDKATFRKHLGAGLKQTVYEPRG